MKIASAAFAPPPDDVRPRPALAVRAGDVLGVADALRLALHVADLAVEMADSGRRSPRTIEMVRHVLRQIRAGA